MSHSKDIDILVSEVGPRDGLQSIKQTMPTDMKKKWISALAQAGLTEIEVGSFVSPKLLPQMADCGELVKHTLTLKDVFVTALVPNLKGAENAFRAGVQKITIPVSVSEPHSLSNIRKTHAEVYEEVNSIIQLRNEKYPEILIEAGLSTVFGCTIQGVVTENEVLTMAQRMAQLGVDEIGLADTVGYANPVQVRSLFKKIKTGSRKFSR